MKKEFGDSPFLWIANNDIPDNAMEEFSDAIRVSNSPYGLNRYQHIHNVVFLSALNPSPAHFIFMKNKGIDGDALRNAMVHQTTYQAIMRCALRDTENIIPITVLVSDKKTVEWLANHFAGCKIGQLDGKQKITKKKNGRPTFDDRPMTGNERIKKFQNKLCNETTYIKALSLQNTSTTVGSIYATKGECINFTDTDDLINQLKECHSATYSDKHDNALISPANFYVDMSPDTSRGLDNITSISGISLDNDGGDLSWQEF